jgi:membrane protein
VARLRSAVERSYVADVVRRFFQLEILDRCFAIAAQAFVALLPLEIVFVGLFFDDGGQTISNAIGDRFGLDGIARSAIRSLFASPGVKSSISWMAVFIAVFSAFSLSRRLSRVYAAIFAIPPLKKSQSWRGIVWVGLQVVLFFTASMLRDFRRDGGFQIFVGGTLALFVVWFVADLAGLKLLVPTVRVPLLLVTAAVSSLGRLAVSLWATIYMPNALDHQASQYGPIGVTFAIFTYLLAGALVYTGAPLLVTTWVMRRDARTTSLYPAQTDI